MTNNNIVSNFSANLWDDGFTGFLEITNKGDPVDSWQVVFESDFSIVQLDNAYQVIGASIVSEQEIAGGRYRYVLEPYSYNQVLDPQESVFITFHAPWLEEENPKLSNLLFQALEDDLEEIDVEFSYDFDSWAGNAGATGSLNFENQSDTTLENWQIELTINSEIGDLPSDIWNARIVSKTLENEVYKYVLDFPSNQDLEPEESHSFEFNTQESSPKVTEITINGQPLDLEIDPPTEPEPPVVEPPVVEPPVVEPPAPPTGNGEVTRPSYNESTGFFTLNGKVYDANGNEFIARGINGMHVWYDNSREQPAKDSLDNIASFGFNSVRIAWDTDYSSHGDFPHDWILEDIIETTIDNKMVPMVELHDFTGSNNTNDLLNRGVKWWTDRAHMWQKYEKSLMINIANEFGDHAFAQGSSRAEFPRVYKEAITRIRNAGIDNTLIIDPFHWGKDYSLVAEYGRDIYEHDPQKNVIFSIHFYGGAGENQGQIHEAFDSITGQGLPMIVGEFGTWRGTSHNIQEDYIMAQAEEYGVGTYPWVWHGGTGDLHGIATHWEASSSNELTPFGQNVIFGDNGVQETSELATIFEF